MPGDGERLGLIAAARHVLKVRTNTLLIASSVSGYFFLAGIQTFGIEFAKDQYRINQAVANVLLLVAGSGAVLGVLAGGAIGDGLLHRGRLNARILTSACAAGAASLLFLPALFTRSPFAAVLYLGAAGFALSAENPPLDAARLDVMPSGLWGRAESIRTSCDRSLRRSRRSPSASCPTTSSAEGARGCNGRSRSC